MPFAARKDDDGSWRLCLRMGVTFRRAVFENREVGIGPFPSQAKTKACADVLNEKCWKAYAAGVKADDMPDWLAADVLDIVAEHGGYHETPTPRNEEITP